MALNSNNIIRKCILSKAFPRKRNWRFKRNRGLGDLENKLNRSKVSESNRIPAMTLENSLQGKPGELEII